LEPPLLSKNTYPLLFVLLGVIYIIGLFVPLMDNDSAHHANIALRMYLTGDYVNLIDNGKDYLDKPHLHFWLCAFSYKIFGVTTFAYKLPSFLFSIGGVCSVYRLGKILFNAETGKLSALIIASSFSFILANNDVRMDAILTASVAFASWQGIAFIENKKVINAIGLSLGLALGFSTKGHIAVFTPAIGLFFYILFKKDWKLFFNWKWIVVLISFAVFISPVVYCYYLQYNLHPEKIVNEKDNINGVKFILLDQSFDRFTGGMGSDAKNDYFFFLHSFFWAFAPWSFICYWALVERIKNIFKRKSEWFSVYTILIMAVVVSVSGFKLPHYLNIVFPAASVLVASWLMLNKLREKIIFRVQVVVITALLLLCTVINFWLFPLENYFLIPVIILLLAAVFHFLRTTGIPFIPKAIYISIFSIFLFFFLFNSNYFPQLLSYQAGKELAEEKEKITGDSDIYFWKDNYSSSFNFYTSSLRKQFDSLSLYNKKSIWLLFTEKDREDILRSGYRIVKQVESKDYEITTFNLRFYIPSTREASLTKMVLAEITVQ
jgi:4-amino-4-deoxy-L-arabinose transferase-like glycosyltransferase